VIPALDVRTLAGLARACIVELLDEGRRVIASVPEGRRIACVPLEVADGQTLTLAIGDDILVHCGEGEDVGVVLGRIGPSRAPVPDPVSVDTPDELVLEAKHSLTLRVGDGSITIREDGKILIKGKDLVSHARRLNRIRGGAVQIN